jgi:hypothetical protein
MLSHFLLQWIIAYFLVVFKFLLIIPLTWTSKLKIYCVLKNNEQIGKFILASTVDLWQNKKVTLNFIFLNNLLKFAERMILFRYYACARKKSLNILYFLLPSARKCLKTEFSSKKIQKYFQIIPNNPFLALKIKINWFFFSKSSLCISFKKSDLSQRTWFISFLKITKKIEKNSLIFTNLCKF